MKNNKLTDDEIKSAKARLSNLLERLSSFDSLSDEKRNEIIELAKTIKDFYSRENFGNDYFYRLIYNIDRNLNSKGIRQVHDKLALLIEIIDPDLELYKDYENCSNVKNLKTLMMIKYGFYNRNFIKAEKLYIKRFYNIDDFDFTKKLEYK